MRPKLIVSLCLRTGGIVCDGYAVVIPTRTQLANSYVFSLPFTKLLYLCLLTCSELKSHQSTSGVAPAISDYNCSLLKSTIWPRPPLVQFHVQDQCTATRLRWFIIIQVTVPCCILPDIQLLRPEPVSFCITDSADTRGTQKQASCLAVRAWDLPAHYG